MNEAYWFSQGQQLVRWARDQYDTALRYRAEGAAFVDALIQRARRLPPDAHRRAALVDLWGAFLGECLRFDLDGVWTRIDDRPALRLQSVQGERVVFPLERVEAQLAAGPARSVYWFYLALTLRLKGQLPEEEPVAVLGPVLRRPDHPFGFQEYRALVHEVSRAWSAERRAKTAWPMRENIRSHERRIWELQALLDAYLARLPTYLLARCPLCGGRVWEAIDTYSLKGPAWHDKQNEPGGVGWGAPPWSRRVPSPFGPPSPTTTSATTPSCSSTASISMERSPKPCRTRSTSAPSAPTSCPPCWSFRRPTPCSTPCPSVGWKTSP
jgi:hypothetical protein